MPRTATFRHQHIEILRIAAEITALLDVSTLATRADDCRRLLSELAGKLTVHLSMEDRALYPKLAVHARVEVRRIASKYKQEMGGLSETFESYNQRWRSARAIQTEAATFIADTRALFGALSRRIEKEDGELYPLVDEA